MKLCSFVRWTHSEFKVLPLRFVIAVPLMLQTGGIVTTVGLAVHCHRGGQTAAKGLVVRLMQAESRQSDQFLGHSLGLGKIALSNAAVIQQGLPFKRLNVTERRASWTRATASFLTQPPKASLTAKNRRYTHTTILVTLNLLVLFSLGLLISRGAIQAIWRRLQAAQRLGTPKREHPVALPQREEWFRRSFEDAAIGMAVWGLDGRFLEVNRALCDLLGYSEAELLSLTVWAILHPDDRALSPTWAEQFSTQSSWANQTEKYQGEKRCLHQQGSLVWVLMHVSLLRNQTGQPSYYVAQMQNSIVRKRSEEALRKNEKQLGLLADSLPVYISYSDTEQRYRFVNKTYETQFGMDRAEIYGKTLREVVGETHYHLMHHYVERVITGESVSYEVTLPDQQGEQHLSVMLIPDFDENTQARGYYSLIIDISSRKKTEAALYQSEKRNRAILSTIPDLMSLVSTDGIYLDLIKRNPKIDLVPSTVNLVGKHITEFLAPEIAVKKLEAIQKALKTGEMQTYEQQLQIDDRIQYEELRVVPYGEDTALIMVRDITERKCVELELRQAKETAEAANRAKSTFLANMSHELRTPLNAILGYAQLMAREADTTPSQQRQLDIINRNGEYLLQLINDVLSISKIEAGRITLEESSCDLFALLNTLEGMFHLRSEMKGLRFVCKRSSNVPQYIYTDERKLRQIITNLLDNAIKFTEQGHVTLRIRVEISKIASLHLGTKSQPVTIPAQAAQAVTQSKPQSKLTQAKPSQSKAAEDLLPKDLVIEVEDTGVGMGADEVDQVFDVFVQTEAGRQSQQGTGLGLPISRRFVQLMQGNMAVISQLGKGTLFRFSLPLKLATAKTGVAHFTKRVTKLAADQPRYRILVVDDTDTNRQLIVHWLVTAGFEVQEAKNGREGIERWSSFEPHLIWLDMRMPIMDGFEAVRRIRQNMAKTRSAPASHPFSQVPTKIIAITAAAFEEERQRILAAGCDDFVAKPCSEAIVLEKIAQHLGARYTYAESSEAERVYGEKANRTQSEQNQTTDVCFTLRPESFHALPVEWLHRLNHTARSANERAIVELLAELPDDHAELKAAIVRLVDNFQLSQLIRLTQSSLTHSSRL